MYYVAEELTGTGMFHYKIVDDFLYYICYQNEEASLNRIKINGGLTFANGEELLSAASLRGYTADREQNLYICTMFQGQVNLCAWSPEGERKFELSLEGEIPQSTGKVGCLAADGAGGWLTGEDGSYVTAEKGKIYIEGEPIPYEYMPREQVDAVLEAIGNIDFTPESVQEQAIVDILVQETAGYFNGEKSLDETVRVIQNRVQLVLGEQTS